jgi:hypothetical protein
MEGGRVLSRRSQESALPYITQAYEDRHYASNKELQGCAF